MLKEKASSNFIWLAFGVISLIIITSHSVELILMNSYFSKRSQEHEKIHSELMNNMLKRSKEHTDIHQELLFRMDSRSKEHEEIKNELTHDN